MAIAVVSHRADALGTNGGTSSAFSSSGANLIVIAVSMYGPGGTLVAGDVTDNQSNTSWVLDGTYIDTNTATSRIHIFHHVAPNTSGSHTVTVTKNTSYLSVAIIAASGAHATTPFDDEDGAGASTAGTSVSPATGITPSADGALVVSALSGYPDPGTLTTPTGYSTPDTGAVSGVTVGFAYKIQVTASAEDPEWTTANSSALSTMVASFLPSVGGGGAKPWVYRSYTHTLGAGAGTAK